MSLLLPWIAGFLGLGVGVLIVGGNSPWLMAFTLVPLLIVAVVIWA